METMAFINIRFEQIFGTSTIIFRNMRIRTYLAEISFISLVGTLAALFFLSGGFENITGKDLGWSFASWFIGALLYLPVLLWLRANEPSKCQYCQERPPEIGRFCRKCDGKYGFSEAKDAAEKIIMNHLREHAKKEESKGV